MFLAILCTAYISSKAQSGEQVAEDIRLLLASAENNFANQLGEVLLEDSETKQVYYQSKKTTDGAKSVVVKSGTTATTKYEYGIVYDLRPAGAVDKFVPVLMAYTEALAGMEKTGNYTVEANASGSVKSVFNKQGKKLISLAWDLQFANIYFYGK